MQGLAAATRAAARPVERQQQQQQLQEGLRNPRLHHGASGGLARLAWLFYFVTQSDAALLAAFLTISLRMAEVAG
jgi:hypothetical protein